MEKIDIVVTWVDGNDPEWRKEKALYQNKDVGDLRDERYRDWDNLQYWFRAIEKYAPWYNNIHFVTWGHVPSWLKTDHPRLRIVKHSDYIPGEYLPTYSARPIEFFLHKIPDLTEKFVYFNDDMFLTAPADPEVFFKDGLPTETAVLNTSTPPAIDLHGNIIPEQQLYLSSIFNVLAVNRHFKKKKSIRANRKKWYTLKYGKELIRNFLLAPWGDFPGFTDTHLPYSFLKSTFDEVWKNEPELLTKACEHKFRESTDVSGRLIAFWQLAEGNFSPRPVRYGHYFRICDDKKKNSAIYRAIRYHKYKMICINDKVSNEKFEKVEAELRAAFEKVLPEKSSFEK